MARYIWRLTLAVPLLTLLLLARPAAAAAPVVGYVIFNEYRSTDNTDSNDFFELLILTDNVDLRGARVSDNELSSGELNTGESVFIFSNESYLADLPAGTIITVWTKIDGITPDTTLDPLNNDWELVLVHDSGVTNNLTDGLGGSIVRGLDSTDALYLYLTGDDGDSTGANVYLDFLAWGGTVAGWLPSGLGGLFFSGAGDNAYFTGSSLSAKNDQANWVTSDASGAANATPGAANPGQDLSALRSANAVELLRFDAQAQPDGAVRLTWETAAEFDTAGFNIMRGATPAAGLADVINAQPIAALGQQGLGATYSFNDDSATPGTWYYWLVALDVAQGSAQYGPAVASVGTPTAVTLRGLTGTSPVAGLLLAAVGIGLLLATRRAVSSNRLHFFTRVIQSLRRPNTCYPRS